MAASKKFTLRIPEPLWEEATILALKKKVSLQSVLLEQLAKWVTEPGREAAKASVERHRSLEEQAFPKITATIESLPSEKLLPTPDSTGVKGVLDKHFG